VSGTLLVTGAQGFVGRWFVATAAAQDGYERVAGLGRSRRRDTFTHRATLGAHSVSAPLPDALRPARATAGRADVEYAACDVRDADALAALLRAKRPRAIVHLASALRDDPPAALFPVNVEGTIALLHAVARSGVAVERIVIGSSGSVYGAPAMLPVREADPVRPPDLYAVSKVAAEESARIVARELGLPVVVARIFNVVGPGLDERHACARLASQLAAIARGYAPPQVVVGDLTPTRDLVDVRDVAAALSILARRGVPGATYNVASGRETAMQHVFDTLLDRSGTRDRVEIVHGYNRPRDCPRVVADIAHAVALGFAPAHATESSLEDLYEYYAGAVAGAIAASSSTPGASRAAVASSATQG
jgi:nucleoside-diphosphate-sugar epimerase